MAGCGRSYMYYGDEPDGGNKEICGNQIDDDGDGLTDCADPDCKNDPSCAGTPEVCTNGFDDDGDGFVDCQDTDCKNHPSCTTKPKEQCTNGIDDDSDGLTDCNDPDCFNHSSCKSTPENCTNGYDDDGDGLIDCKDPQCFTHPACKKTENCTNKVDDDGDGLADCYDPDCYNHPACAKKENCTNGVDDDNDGLVDCKDPDCKSHPKCTVTTPEICTNGYDDDGDGFTDCKDTDCYSHPSCAGLNEICTNGKDDDSDGLIDCKDPDCAKHPSCGGKPEDCTNGVDDDGDKAIDCADSDCKNHPTCIVNPEICTNKKDDDGDKLVDCQDPDCFKHPNCKAVGKEICNNGIDDDEDGKVDCDDSDCSWLPICKKGTEICGNKKDDDGDGAIDCSDPDCKSYPACQTILCKPSVNFGSIKPKGSSSTRTITNTGTKDTYTSPCAVPGGGEIVSTFTLTGKADVKLTYNQLSGDHVFSLFRAGVGEACNANSRGCFDPKSKKSGDFSIKALPAGTYYLIVEAFAKTLEGKVTVTLSTGGGSSKEVCNNGVDDDKDGATDCADLECALHPSCASNLCKYDVNLGTLVINGPGKSASVNTATAKNTYDLVCAAGKGGDRVIRFVMPTAAVVGVTVSQKGWHAFGMHRSKGPGTKCNASKAGCLQKQWPGMVIDYGTTEKGEYFYIVDAMKPGYGGQVNLTFKAYKNRGPELCQNNIDDDGDGLVDCMDPDCTGVVGCPGPVCVPDKKTGPMGIGSTVNITVDTKKENNDQTVSCALGGGKDAVIEIILTKPTALRVQCNQTGDHVLGFFAKGKPRDPCDKSKLGCADPKTGPIGCNFYWGNVQPGTYYLVVEAFKPGSEGTFNLKLTATKDTIQEICNNGKDDDGDGLIDCKDYNCATKPYCTSKTCTPDQKLGVIPTTGKVINVAATTKGAGDSAHASCAKTGGEEVALGFTLPGNADLTVAWAQFGNHVLGVYHDKGTGFSCDAAPVKCTPTSSKVSGTTTFKNLAAGQYFLLVDAYAGGQEGSAVLKISAK